MTSTAAVTAGCVGALLAAAAGPYLAGLTLTAPDRSDTGWWRSAWTQRRSVGRRRSVATSGVGLCCGALAGAAAGWTAALPAFLWLALIATPLAITDLEVRRLPDRLTGTGFLGAAALLGMAAVALGSGGQLTRAVTAAVAVFAVFVGMTLMGGVKFGDTKLAALLAGYLGWLGWVHVVYGLLAGFVIAALAGLVMLAARRNAWTSDFAFGPALIVGALIVAALPLAAT